jgi:lysophospholipid acyltransferase (LPLAT)-like uncharacterized protein
MRLPKGTLASAVALWLVPRVASLVMRAGVRTLRRRDVGREHPEGCLAKGKSVIVAFWHGRLLLMPFVYPGRQATILISQHRDGEYIARIAQRLGFAVKRGSVIRGGARAFRNLVLALKEGRHVAVTPDGPRGPARRVKSGTIELSRLSGMPILPVSVDAHPRFVFRSWDRFVVPYPFAHVVYVWGPPVYVPPHLSRVEAERFEHLLAERLDDATADADRLAGSRAS